MNGSNAQVSHVVGARPNFMKSAPVLAALRELRVEQRLIHTGQHYSDALSDVFFRELDLPPADVNLGVGSGTHAAQTGAIMIALEGELLEHRPGLLVIYGDINSTLAGAIVAAKLGVPIAHVEAGLRSFDRSMPEEINRVVADALCDLLFTTSPEAEANLRSEGVTEGIHFVGNPMIDTLMRLRDRFDPAPLIDRFSLPAEYGVVTIHRPADVDTPAAAARVTDSLLTAAALLPLIVPLHPRGRVSLAAAGLVNGPNLRIVEPLGYVDFLSLVSGARLVITDSGGIQEETTILRIPCLTLRPNTERPITITRGTNRLVEPEALGTAVARALSGKSSVDTDPPPLWDGSAGRRIAEVIQSWLWESRP